MVETTSDKLGPLRDRLVEIQGLITDLEEAKTKIKDEMRSILNTYGPGTYEAGSGQVVVQNNRRLDTAGIAAKYPPTEHPEIYDLIISVRKAREVLPEDELESFMRIIGEVKIIAS